jgi:hypothetical protein
LELLLSLKLFDPPMFRSNQQPVFQCSSHSLPENNQEQLFHILVWTTELSVSGWYGFTTLHRIIKVWGKSMEDS